MRAPILLLLFASLLVLGCTDTSKPKASPSTTPTKTPITEIIGNASPTPLPTPTPYPIRITSKPIANVSNLTAIISWGTSAKSNSIVEWGEEGGDLVNTESKNDNVTSHAVNLTSLSFLTSYKYRVISCISDSCNKSLESNFTTGHKQCMGGTSYIPGADVCMDSFEATVVQGKAVSQAGSVPASSVSRADAQKACALSGKRLCTSAEFDSACNINGVKEGNIGITECQLVNSSYVGAGYPTRCISSFGVHDLIGNFWDWVSDSVTEKTPFYEGLVDRDDILAAGSEYQLPRQNNAETEKRGGDYYYNVEPSRYAFIGKGIARGGYYSSQSLGGCYAYQVGVPLEGDTKIGFRCCS